MFKIIFFDFDGVIVNTFFEAYSIMRQKNPNLSLDQYRNAFNAGIYSEIKTHKINPVDNFFQQYDQQIADDDFVTGMNSLLQSLSQKYKLYIVSSTYTDSILRYLEKHNLHQYFKGILGGDQGHSKSIKIKQILNQEKVEPQESIMITDTMGDVEEANEVKVASIAVSWGYQDKSTLLKSGAVAVVDDVDQLKSEIQEKQ